MGKIDKVSPAKEGYYTSMLDPTRFWADRGLNVRTSLIPLGDEGDPKTPGIGVLDIKAGPGDRLRGRHIHFCDAINLVVEGALYMDGVWFRPGQASIVPADYEYGDAVAGPDGVRFLEMFSDIGKATPRFVEPEDQAFYEKLHGDPFAKVLPVTRGA